MSADTVWLVRAGEESRHAARFAANNVIAVGWPKIDGLRDLRGLSEAEILRLLRVSPLTEQNFEWPPSRNFRAFGNFNEVDTRLRPGMNGRLDVIVSRLRDAISVPAKAVFTRNGKAVVLTPHEGGWKPIEVTVVARNPDEVAITGVAAGTTVALTDDLAKERKPS